MGVTQSTDNFNTNRHLQKLRHIEQLNDRQSLYQCPQTLKKYLTVSYTFGSHQQLQVFQNEFKKRLIMRHTNYLQPIDSFSISANNICSKQHKLIQLYPYQTYTLLKQIEQRQKSNKSFTNKEIWSILCNCVLVMSNLSKNDILHYTLNPSDICLDSEGNVYIIPMELSSYQFDFNIHKDYYYSPEMFKALKNTTNTNINNKSGVFTLAITILHLITLKSMTQLYNFEQLQISIQLLTGYLDKIVDDDIRYILRKMVKIPQYERITFTQLQEMLYGILTRKNTQYQQLERLDDSIQRIDIPQEDVNIQSFRGINAVTSNRLFEDKLSILNPLAMDQQDKNGYFDEIKNNNQQQKIDEQQSYLYEVEQKYKSTSFLQDKSNTYQEQSNECSIKQTKFSIFKESNIIPTVHKNIVTSKKKQKENSKQLQAKHIEQKNQRQQPKYVIEQYNSGKFQGYKINDKRHGFGTFYYYQGGKYSGDWIQNKMQGHGTLFYKNGSVAYDGMWEKDKLHGYGILYNETPTSINTFYDYKNLALIKSQWLKYQGYFKEDQRNGDGTLFLTNGQYYQGFFKNDLPDGVGIYKTLKKNIIKGVWKRGHFEQVETRIL